MHTDIKTNGLIGVLPARVRPYAVLARLDRPAGWWLLLLPGWWAILLAGGGALSLNAADWHVFTLFFIGAVVMRGAGCVINDLWDRDLDKKVERTCLRPIAAGEVSPRHGFVFLGALLLVGFLVLIQMNFLTVLLGILSLPLIAVYPLMKRVTWWPQLFLGLTFNFGALMGWSALTGTLGLPALCLYAAGILWTLSYDTVYAHQDKEDDALAGIKSTALKFGDKSKKWVAGFFAASIFFLLLAGATAGVAPGFYAGMAAGAVYALWQMNKWNPADAASSLQAFKSNRDFGLIVLAACALS